MIVVSIANIQDGVLKYNASVQDDYWSENIISNRFDLLDKMGRAVIIHDNKVILKENDLHRKISQKSKRKAG